MAHALQPRRLRGPAWGGEPGPAREETFKQVSVSRVKSVTPPDVRPQPAPSAVLGDVIVGAQSYISLTREGLH